MNKEYNDAKEKIRKLLSASLGIEPEDVEDDFSLTEDLHMKSTDLTDFSLILSKEGFDTENLDFTEIETFADLVDSII